MSKADKAELKDKLGSFLVDLIRELEPEAEEIVSKKRKEKKDDQ